MRWEHLAALIVIALPMSARAQTPPSGAWFRYRYEQHLENGRGEYDGYGEATIARARYEIVDVDAAQAQVHARYAWTYSSSERTESASEDRTVTFSLPDRHYTSSMTDVSDYDGQSASSLATWLWIPPTVRQGEQVQILERTFRVMSIGIPIEVAGEPRRAISVMTQTNDARDDEYGDLSTTITDRYWYDGDTGMFLREVHEEEATGTLEGRSASFRLVTTVEVIDASYARAANPPPPEDYSTPPDAPSFGAARSVPPIKLFVCLGVLLLGVGFAVFVGRAMLRRRRRGARQSAKGETFDVSEVRDPSKVALRGGLSASFDPFLPHMIQVATAAGQVVSTATTKEGTLLGLAIADRDADLGTIFAADSDVCEALRLSIGHSEFFSEIRHPALASVTKLNLSSSAEAYNIYETYEVMRLGTRPHDLGFAGEVVRTMKDADRPAVVELLKTAYGVPAQKWLDASMDAGDFAWVAHEGDRIVGLAMATVVGTRARLHTLTVHPEHRARGLGTALYRARLRGLFDLGVSDVLTECATWNVAALELARSHGFEKTGVMYVESARSERVERKFVRR